MTDQMAGGEQVQIQGQPFPVTVVDGHIRIHLPFRIDPHELTRYLMGEGYPLSHEPGEVTDAQGWAPEFDPQAYYQWWVYPDPAHEGGYCFALNPRPGDVVERGADIVPSLTPDSLQDVTRWVPILQRFTQVEQEGWGD